MRCTKLSIRLFTRTLTLLVVDSPSFKIEEFFHKMAISLKNCRVEEKNHSSLARRHDLSFSGDHLLRLLDVFLSIALYTSVSLFHSPRHDSRRRFLLMLVPSQSDTHHLNRYTVGCSCHELLIPCSATVLFSTTFLLICISCVEVEGEGEFI